jgi:hypothetical protein
MAREIHRLEGRKGLTEAGHEPAFFTPKNRNLLQPNPFMGFGAYHYIL